MPMDRRWENETCLRQNIIYSGNEELHMRVELPGLGLGLVISYNDQLASSKPTHGMDTIKPRMDVERLKNKDINTKYKV